MSAPSAALAELPARGKGEDSGSPVNVKHRPLSGPLGSSWLCRRIRPSSPLAAEQPGIVPNRSVGNVWDTSELGRENFT